MFSTLLTLKTTLVNSLSFASREKYIMSVGFNQSLLTIKRLLVLKCLICASILSIISVQAFAEMSFDYPNKPITFVIPFPPAGSTDVLGRILAQVMGKSLNQTVLVENTGGAGGTIGAAKVARAPADGYTILFHNMAHASAPALYAKLSYEPIADFEPIGYVNAVPMILVARKGFAFEDIKGVIGYAKSYPGKINFANAGVGSTSHLCDVLFQYTSGSNWLNIPYKGTGPALNDLLGGQVDMICDQPASTIGHIKSGGVKAIAVATPTRLKILPDVPTFAESGLPGFELAVWHGLYAPKGTPRVVIDKLSAALRVALKDPQLVQKYTEMSAIIATPEQATPEFLKGFLKNDLERWKVAMKAAGVQPE
jgi:tripartite-type tricarboxylate transporter receptor subunit TctC